MTNEQKFVKCLYTAYTKSIPLYFRVFDSYNEELLRLEEYDNSFWDDMTEEEALEVIKEDPDAAYFDNLRNYLKNDTIDFYIGTKDGTTQLCFKNEDMLAFNSRGIKQFLKSA